MVDLKYLIHLGLFAELEPFQMYTLYAGRQCLLLQDLHSCE